MSVSDAADAAGALYYLRAQLPSCLYHTLPHPRIKNRNPRSDGARRQYAKPCSWTTETPSPPPPEEFSRFDRLFYSTPTLYMCAICIRATTFTLLIYTCILVYFMLALMVLVLLLFPLTHTSLLSLSISQSL